MDKNQLLGAIIISLAVILYINYFGPKKQEKKIQKTEVNKEINSSISKKTVSSNINEKIKSNINYNDLAKYTEGEEKDIILENKNLKITFNTKGARIKEIILKKYKNGKGKPLKLADDKSSQMGLEFNYKNLLINTYDLFFEVEKFDNKSITFKINIGEDEYIKERYYLKDEEIYELGYDIETKGLENDVKDKKISFVWKNNLIPLENDIARSREKSTINYYLNSDKFKSLKIKAKDKSGKLITEPIKWIAMKQRFFTSSLISNDNFQNANIYTIPTPENKDIIKIAYAKLDLPFDKINNKNYKLTFFFGPNKYDILKKVTKGFSNNLFLGWPIVKWINRFFTTPLFSFLSQFITNCGILIIVLVLIIKLLLFPLSYKSQIATAKMKILKPELDEIKEKFKDDKQKIQMAQVALYKEMGVNPLSGCIPILLQMPILIAMFNFFPNAIELRQASFLWVKDLSTYDSILTLPFTIPMYGDHVSLFALLMTISTIISTLTNSQMSNNADPSMKMFTYMMPLMFMVILNSHPAALSFYYFVSNLMSLLQQFIINKFVDEKALRIKLEENKKKGTSETTKPRAFARLEKMLDKKKKKK